MSTLLFVAQITGDPAAGYDATFPDLENCVVHAGDLAELLTKARGAILAHLQALSDGGEAWPVPSPIEQIQAKPGTITILVDVSVDDPPVRVNISLGERLLERLDAAAEMRGMTRSGFIAQAVRVSLGERPHPNAEFDAFGRRLQDEMNTLGRRINDSIGPESPFSRRMNELDDYVYDGVRRAADSVSAAMKRRKTAAGAADHTEADTPPRNI
jgi:predicted RNase H-like HicB family nuclease